MMLFFISHHYFPSQQEWFRVASMLQIIHVTGGTHIHHNCHVHMCVCVRLCSVRLFKRSFCLSNSLRKWCRSWIHPRWANFRRNLFLCFCINVCAVNTTQSNLKFLLNDRKMLECTGKLRWSSWSRSKMNPFIRYRPITKARIVCVCMREEEKPSFNWAYKMEVFNWWSYFCPLFHASPTVFPCSILYPFCLVLFVVICKCSFHFRLRNCVGMWKGFKERKGLAICWVDKHLNVKVCL